jgi:Tol biopolymer transport system component/class 3 adenylate cyclase
MPETRQLAAIMFTDIVGYTALMGRDHYKAMKLLKRNKDIQKAFVKRYHGVLHTELGDGTMSTFQSVSDALDCAISLQQEIAEEDLDLRIGIHLGEVVFEENDAFGDGVNIASRLEGLGVAGSVIISEKVKREIKYQSNFSTLFMGTFQLKNVENPVLVYAVNAEGLTIPALKQMQGKATLISEKENTKKEPLPIRILILSLAVLGGLALTMFALSSYFDFFKKEGSSEEPYILTPLTTSAIIEGYESWSPDGRMFTYISLASGNPDIYIKNRTGGDPVQIVDTPYDEYSPRWSPDGSKIAYMSVREGSTNIYWVPSTGGLERKLAETHMPGLAQDQWALVSFGTAPWSPDGNEILFSRLYEDGTLAISKINMQTGLETQVTKPPHGNNDLAASFSPNGESIVFVRNGKIWLKSLKGNQKEQLLIYDHTTAFTTFSADNRKIIFTSEEGGVSNIWELMIATGALKLLTYSTDHLENVSVIPSGGLSVDQFSHQVDLILLNTENKEEEQLTNHNGDNFYGRFSPDGKKIIYESSRTGDSEIWMIDLSESKKEINLTNNTSSIDIRADWSPKGDQIAFVSNRDSTSHVWIMDSEGKNLRKASEKIVELSTGSFGYANQVKWSPDGRRIGYIAGSEGGTSLWIADPDSNSSRPVISQVTTFAWYQNSNMIICNRNATEKANATDLVIINIETGEEKILKQDLPLTEIFASSDGQWLGYTSAVGHFSFNIFRLKLDPPHSSKGFPTVIGNPEQITHGAGKWHVHHGSFSPDNKSILYSRDVDRMDILLIANYK